MLKKILAASSAAVVAVSALASTAMAATSDDYTIVIENVNDYKMVTLDLTASLSANQIKELIGETKDGKDNLVASKIGNDQVLATMYNTADDSENSYANLVLSVWMADFDNLQGRDSNYKTQDRNDGKSGKYTWNDVTFNGATIKVDLEADVQPKYMIPAGYVLPWDGDWVPDEYYNAQENYTVGGNGLVVDLGRDGGASGYEWDSRGRKLVTEADNKTLKIYNRNTAVGPTQVSFTDENTIAKTASWKNFDSRNSTLGHVVTPTSMKPKFGLTSMALLDAILYNKSSVSVDFSVTMPEYAYYGMMYGTEAQGYYWDWTDTCWKDSNGKKVTNFADILNGTNAKNSINDYFGIVGQSWGSGTNCSGGISAGGIEVKVKNVTAEDVHKVNPLSLDRWYSVALGINATPTRLKNMNNGGTIEFIFKNEIWSGSFLSVETILRSASGVASVPLASEFAFAESGKSVSLPFPAGLTGGSAANPFNSFWLDYVVKGTGWYDPNGVNSGNLDGSHGWLGDATNPTQWNNELVQIVIHANKEAPKDDTSSSTNTSSSSTSDGGLVSSSNTSSSTSSSTTSSATNSGSNNNEKNPGTGVAVAVAPVVLAAAGAAVVISKKRK